MRKMLAVDTQNLGTDAVGIQVFCLYHRELSEGLLFDMNHCICAKVVTGNRKKALVKMCVLQNITWVSKI